MRDYLNPQAAANKLEIPRSSIAKMTEIGSDKLFNCGTIRVRIDVATYAGHSDAFPKMGFKLIETCIILVDEVPSLPTDAECRVLGEKYGNYWGSGRKPGDEPVRGPVDILEHIIRSRDLASPANAGVSPETVLDTDSFDAAASVFPSTGPAAWFTGRQFLEGKDSSFDYLDALAKCCMLLVVPRHDGRRALKPWWANPCSTGLTLTQADFVEGSIQDAGETDPSLCFTQFELQFDPNPNAGYNSVAAVKNVEETDFPDSSAGTVVYKPTDGIAMTRSVDGYIKDAARYVFTFPPAYAGAITVGTVLKLSGGYNGLAFERTVNWVASPSSTIFNVAVPWVFGDPDIGEAVLRKDGVVKYRAETFLDWRTWVTGLPKSMDPDVAYNLAKGLWKRARANYLKTGSKATFKMDCPFFPNPADFPGVTAYPAPFLLLDRLIDWVGTRKRITRAKLPLTPRNHAFEGGDGFYFREKKITEDRRYFAWFSDLALVEDADGKIEIECEITWFPDREVDAELPLKFTTEETIHTVDEELELHFVGA